MGICPRYSTYGSDKVWTVCSSILVPCSYAIKIESEGLREEKRAGYLVGHDKMYCCFLRDRSILRQLRAGTGQKDHVMETSLIFHCSLLTASEKIKEKINTKKQIKHGLKVKQCARYRRW